MVGARLRDGDPVKLVAAMIARNELGRYLELAVEHALTYCDEVALWDDGSTDGTLERAGVRASVLSSSRVKWGGRLDELASERLHFEHEGRARQALLEHVLEQDPTHVLIIDADEFVSDGRALRDALAVDTGHTAYRVCMEEVWGADDDELAIRCDGGWRPHPIVGVFRPPRELYGDWRMADKALACPREPIILHRIPDVVELDVSILHFGWACVADRAARIARYTVVDGGRFHRNAHIESIGWADDRCDLERIPWPEGLGSVRDRLLERASRGAPS